MSFLDSGFSTISVVPSAPNDVDVHAGQRVCTPLYALLARHLMI